ncbi:Nnf1-domain-containing protein [Scheffersomyces coipomensis]|uniref:Nnf1-domain-containing protein n=1 Tax=Scheffersomyces coipomensis TaxID=1788519 RepID=UPI00315D540E
MTETTSDVTKIRFERLELVTRKALEHSIKKSLSLDQIKTCYPTIASTDEGVKALEIARSQMINFWRTSSLKEFDLIFKEKDIENKLNELDEIISIAQQRKRDGVEAPTKIENYTPKEIIESTLLSNGSTTMVENLSMIYKQLCLDNREFYEELKQLGSESEDLKQEINDSISTLEKEIETINKYNPRESIENLINNYSKK